ncbi:MAG: hypothetical protein IJ925_09965 [Muribaculaceae bacterium]|nr:hypothetical protein [Muribaculaceae bacterium]
MKKLITIILVLMTATTISQAQEIDKMELRLAIQWQMSTYPESTLQDIYKAFYQDYFGPEHMITDTAAVRDYLYRELAQSDDGARGLYYEPVGWKGNYVRVYLSTVNDQLITAQQLLQAFIDSANECPPQPVEWKDLWKFIVDVTIEMGLELKDFDKDLPLLTKASQRNQAVHHSTAYNAAYHPHYRIVERNIFEMLLKPDIDR